MSIRLKQKKGMGIRHLHMNDAILLKLVWQLFTRPDALWVQVMKGEYRFDVVQRLGSIHRNGALALWSSLSLLWPIFIANLRWALGDMMNVRFWKNLSFGEESLVIHGINLDEYAFEHILVRDFLTEDGASNNNELLHCLLEEIALKVTNLISLFLQFRVDEPYLAITFFVIFFASSAYEYLREESDNGAVLPSKLNIVHSMVAAIASIVALSDMVYDTNRRKENVLIGWNPLHETGHSRLFAKAMGGVDYAYIQEKEHCGGPYGK
ncbi:Uncharacterized protein TCM_040742 [Theobroma cacao]|uniref:Uncharacterized protein n=1 Tax=Theobroma cacao TaxID=3641 RepID=A0A061GTB5_THECC|nr:Uncharacterized protein TCM_040742 [Theobroma cacao]